MTSEGESLSTRRGLAASGFRYRGFPAQVMQIVGILAALSFMGSFGGGLLVGAEYGKWVGWTTFGIFVALGIILDKVADKTREPHR